MQPLHFFYVDFQIRNEIFYQKLWVHRNDLHRTESARLATLQGELLAVRVPDWNPAGRPRPRERSVRVAGGALSRVHSTAVQDARAHDTHTPGEVRHETLQLPARRSEGDCCSDAASGWTACREGAQ